MRVSTALPMGRHLTVPLVTISLRFSPLGEDRPTAETTLEDCRSTDAIGVVIPFPVVLPLTHNFQRENALS